MTGFLVEYHRPSGDWYVRAFEGENGAREAMLERFRLEELRASADFEIAVLIADSLETIKKTHSRYFGGREREAEFSLLPIAA
ncbi:hypothetical protein D1J51_03470 [Leucobacter sp. wl10]|nr:hypothetical protein D1J51_03470 [Leucobacter sp. wl10]